LRAWADARPITQHDRPDEDRFRAYIGAMIGIGTPAFRDADSISDFAKLPYAGLLAARVKSVSRLRAFLTSYLETRVEIEEFVNDTVVKRTSSQTETDTCRIIADQPAVEHPP